MKQRLSRYRWELLALLFAAFFLNQGDRQIYNAVLPLLKIDLSLSDVELGAVVTVFTVLFGVFVPLAGCLGDFVSKKWIVCLSLLTFSAGTLCTGFSNGLFLLIVFRSVATGIGEAFYVPAANALIGQYHSASRGLALAIHQTALYVGVVASSWMAGWVGQQYGWRSAFYLFGFFGLFLASVMALRLRNERTDPEFHGTVAGAPAAVPVQDVPAGLGEVLRGIFRVPTMYFLSAAYGGMVFVFVGYMTWMPTFLHEKFGLAVQDAALNAVLVHFLFAFIGVMTGGRFSDRLAMRRPAIRMEVSGLGLLLGAPFIWFLGVSPSLFGVYVALAGFGFFRGVFDSNLFAVPFDVIPTRYISSATGIMISCAFLIGSTSPIIMGHLKERIDLSFGLSSLSVMYFLGAALMFIARAWFFARDRMANERRSG